MSIQPLNSDDRIDIYRQHRRSSVGGAVNYNITYLLNVNDYGSRLSVPNGSKSIELVVNCICDGGNQPTLQYGKIKVGQDTYYLDISAGGSTNDKSFALATIYKYVKNALSNLEEMATKRTYRDSPFKNEIYAILLQSVDESFGAMEQLTGKRIEGINGGQFVPRSFNKSEREFGSWREYQIHRRTTLGILAPTSLRPYEVHIHWSCSEGEENM